MFLLTIVRQLSFLGLDSSSQLNDYPSTDYLFFKPERAKVGSLKSLDCFGSHQSCIARKAESWDVQPGEGSVIPHFKL